MRAAVESYDQYALVNNIVACHHHHSSLPSLVTGPLIMLPLISKATKFVKFAIPAHQVPQKDGKTEAK